jgi:hypothetical protein
MLCSFRCSISRRFTLTETSTLGDRDSGRDRTGRRDEVRSGSRVCENVVP